MIQSFIVYFIAIFILEACAIKYKDLGLSRIYFKHPLIIWMLLFYTLLCACRYNVGVDYLTYLDEYERYKIYSSYKGVNNFEPGWAWFSWILSNKDIPYTVYFGIIAFAQFCFLLIAFKKRPYLLPSVIFAFFIGHFFLDFQNVIRQNLVMSIFLILVMNKEDIGFIKSLIVLGLCFFIHKSVIVAILLLPLTYVSKVYKYEFKVAPLLSLLCIFIGLKYNIFSGIINNNIFVNTVSNSDYSYYLNDEFISLGLDKTIGVGFLLKCIIDLLLISSGNKMSRYYSHDDKFIICYRFFYVGKCLKYLIPTSMVLGRPLLYLTFFSLPILAYFFHYFTNKYKGLSAYEKVKNVTT